MSCIDHPDAPHKKVEAFAPFPILPSPMRDPLQPLSSSRACIISSTSEGWAPKTSARISLAVSSSWRLGFTAGLCALFLRRYGPSHENRGGLACQLLRDSSALAVGLPLHVIEAEDPGRRGHGFQVPVQYGGVKEDAPERPASWPGQRGPPYSWPFRTPMLHYQEGVVVLLQDGPQLGRR